MSVVVKNIKWIMLVAGLATCSTAFCGFCAARRVNEHVQVPI